MSNENAGLQSSSQIQPRGPCHAWEGRGAHLTGSQKGTPLREMMAADAPPLPPCNGPENQMGMSQCSKGSAAMDAARPSNRRSGSMGAREWAGSLVGTSGLPCPTPMRCNAVPGWAGSTYTGRGTARWRPQGMWRWMVSLGGGHTIAGVAGDKGHVTVNDRHQVRFVLPEATQGSHARQETPNTMRPDIAPSHMPLRGTSMGHTRG